MVEEKGSVRGKEKEKEKGCAPRISSPVRMCHPMSASASGRFDKGPASSDQKRKMKMMSRTEGSRKCRADELGSDGGIKVEGAVYKVSGHRVIRSSVIGPSGVKDISPLVCCPLNSLKKSVIPTGAEGPCVFN